MTFRHLSNARGFFSDYYLGTVFAAGSGRGRRRKLSDAATDRAFDRLRRIWDRAQTRAQDRTEVRENLGRPLFRDVLNFHLGAGEESVHGLYASAEVESKGARPLLLLYVGEWDEDLDAPAQGKGRGPSAHLAQRLSQADLDYGFLVTGQRLRLIRRAGEGPRGAYLELDLEGCLEAEDRESFAAAYRLFEHSNFLPADDGVRPIDRIEKESREHAEKVSEDLKRAVFAAAESLVQGLIDDWVAEAPADESRDRLKLTEADLTTFRDAALTTLYRLLFILYAEARDERLQQHSLYLDSYSLQTLTEGLLPLNPGEIPANRHGYWERLLALFRIYDKGLPALSPYDRIPERGGDLFDCTIPEGQLLEQARLDDRTVARLLLDLTTTVPRLGVGRERVSFRELDIEQLGAVYEGLLEHEPKIARETTIEVRVQGRTYALSAEELIRLCEQKDLRLAGELEVVEGTTAEALHPEGAPADEGEEEEETEEEQPEAEEAAAEGEEEDRGVKKGASARLLRRIEPGQFNFVPGSARKGTGSYYTVTPIVQDLVRHALGPLVEGKSAAGIESLRVLDPATGSAHFLVGAMRFLGQALHRAYCDEFGDKAPANFRGNWDTHWQASDEEARVMGSEARAWSKRRIAERCLFGVDLNRMAVNLARVSLWIESLAGDRPLTYFEHHIRRGNSILGTWLERLPQPPIPSLGKPLPTGQADLFIGQTEKLIQEAAQKRALIDIAGDEEAVEPESIEELHYKADRLEEAEAILRGARLLFDLRAASAFAPKIWSDFPALCQLVGDPEALERRAEESRWWEDFKAVRERERFFHWELEFPEIFLNGRLGFDAVIGNPPWDKIKPDKKEFYGKADILIRAYVGGELDRRIAELHEQFPGLKADFERYQARIKATAAVIKRSGDYSFHDWKVDGKTTGGDPDVFKFFVERAHRVVREGGRVGFLVPSAIYNNEGCTGLRHLLLNEAKVERFYAFENRRKIFPIDSRYKFVSLVFRKGKCESADFQAAFMRHDLDELTDASPKPWMVWIKKEELERLSPGTLAFLEFRSPRDREIVLRMYEGRPLLGDQGPGTWNAKFYREYDMTNDRDLWTDPKTGKLWTVQQILGFTPGDFQETRALMAEKGFWPLYQDAHIHQYVLEFKPLMRWVSLEAHHRKYGGLPDASAKLVLRRPARATDERTCIAAILPSQSCFGHTLHGVAVHEDDQGPLLAALNSIAFDYLLRKRVAGQDIMPHLLGRTAVPVPDSLTCEPATVPLVHAGQTKTWVYNEDSHWQGLWNMELAVARAYDVKAEDMAFILQDFPVFARKRPAFLAYLLARLEEWKAE